jgi:hypothetical protein
MFKPKYDFEWDMLGIYNYKQKGKLYHYFEFLTKNLNKKGDLIEAGVFRGSSLLSVALFLKEKGSNKKVFGYDSFTGFPPIYHKYDSIEFFKELFISKQISNEHYEQVLSSNTIRELFQKQVGKDIGSVSTSGKFDNTSKNLLEKKIDYLELDNIILIDGTFDKTMMGDSINAPETILGGIVDCDLYKSYKTTLNFVWPKLIKGGGLYLDEYYSLKFPGGKIAVDEFLQENNGELIKYHNNKLLFERWMVQKIN